MYTEITSLGLNFIEHTYYMIFDFILNMFSLFSVCVVYGNYSCYLLMACDLCIILVHLCICMFVCIYIYIGI